MKHKRVCFQKVIYIPIGIKKVSKLLACFSKKLIQHMYIAGCCSWAVLPDGRLGFASRLEEMMAVVAESHQPFLRWVQTATPPQGSDVQFTRVNTRIVQAWGVGGLVLRLSEKPWINSTLKQRVLGRMGVVSVEELNLGVHRVSLGQRRAWLPRGWPSLGWVPHTFSCRPLYYPGFAFPHL